MKTYTKPSSTILNSTQFKGFFSSFAGGFMAKFGVAVISSANKNLSNVKFLKAAK